MSQQWLKSFHEQNYREVIRGESGKWVKQPTIAVNQLPFRRSPSLFAAMRYHRQWDFQQEEQIAVTFALEGAAHAKENFVIGFGSELSDFQGYYIILSKSGARVIRPLPSETKLGNGYGEISYREIQGGVLSVTEPLHQSGLSIATMIYDNGSFRLFEGTDPNQPGKMLVSFDDPRPKAGVHLFGFGMLGDPRSSDEVKLVYIQKWRK